MRSGSFARMASVTATTQREGAPVAGIAAALADSVVDFKCTPLDPLTPEVAQMTGIGAFAELLQTFCEGGLDIKPKDTLITGGVTYYVRAVGEWYWRPTDSNTLTIVLEEVK